MHNAEYAHGRFRTKHARALRNSNKKSSRKRKETLRPYNPIQHIDSTTFNLNALTIDLMIVAVVKAFHSTRASSAPSRDFLMGNAAGTIITDTEHE